MSEKQYLYVAGICFVSAGLLKWIMPNVSSIGLWTLIIVGLLCVIIGLKRK